MRTLLAALALFTSTTALAEVYTAREEGFHFSLSRAVPTSAFDGDLHVGPTGVVAKHGVKRQSRSGEFMAREVAVLGEAYDLNDAEGGKWRLWIRTTAGSALTVELVRAHGEAPAVQQSFRKMSITIDGAQAKPTFAPLELLTNGTYKLGTANGRYVRDEGGVRLDGVPAQWGRGILSVDGQTLSFKYLRGHAEFAVQYELDTRVAER